MSMNNTTNTTSDEFLDRLRRIVEQSRPEVRNETQRALAAVLEAGGKSFRDLLAILRMPRVSPEIRYSAARFLGQLGSKRAVPAFVAVLSDPDPHLRAEAARWLGHLGSKRAVLPLTELLRRDRDVEVRKSAAYALGNLGDERALLALVDALREVTEAAEVRGMAAEQLSRYRDGRAVQPLLEALHDGSAEVRFWSAYALGALGAAEALPALERLAATDEAVVPRWWSVGREAGEAAETIRARQAGREDG